MIFKDTTPEITRIVTDAFKQVTTSYIEQLSKLEQEHWKQLEKQSTKQLQILEKQTKDFMQVMGNFIEASKPVPVPPPPVMHSDLLDKILDKENTIEKEEVEEQNLEDIPRIPMTNGINLMFDGDETIHPINIEEHGN